MSRSSSIDSDEREMASLRKQKVAAAQVNLHTSTSHASNFRLKD